MYIFALRCLIIFIKIVGCWVQESWRKNPKITFIIKWILGSGSSHELRVWNYASLLMESSSYPLRNNSLFLCYLSHHFVGSSNIQRWRKMLQQIWERLGDILWEGALSSHTRNILKKFNSNCVNVFDLTSLVL